jgi:hypothetical protein
MSIKGGLYFVPKGPGLFLPVNSEGEALGDVTSDPDAFRQRLERGGKPKPLGPPIKETPAKRGRKPKATDDQSGDDDAEGDEDGEGGGEGADGVADII